MDLIEIQLAVSAIVAAALVLSFLSERLTPLYLKCCDRMFGSDRFAQWEEKFRPLSDEEFLSRCSPGVRPETALKVRAILSDQLGIPVEQIHPEHRFIEDLDCC